MTNKTYKILSFISAMIFSIASQAATFSCNVIQCNDVMVNCPDNIYVLEGSDRIVFNFHNTDLDNIQVPIELEYPSLGYSKTDEALVITDEYDMLFNGVKAENGLYVGTFETFQTLSDIEEAPVVTAEVSCSQVN